MSKKVLVTSRSFGRISDEPLNILKNANFEITMKGNNFDQAEFERIIPDYDALIIGPHDFLPEVMERCRNLKLICKHGAGLDNIHLDKAAELDITVCNVAGINSNAVADFTFGLIIDLARGITLTNNWVHEGRWKAVIGTDVCHKTLGLIGFGAIAKEVARRAEGFGMKVLAYDPFVKELSGSFRHSVTLCDKNQVIADCDFLSIHVPLNDKTKHIISDAELSHMKKGSYIINCARGGIVNERALYEALVSGHIAGAAMDVSEIEPIEHKNPLLTMDNVIVTPHIGMYSKEAIGAVSLICAQNVVNYFNNAELQCRVI